MARLLTDPARRLPAAAPTAGSRTVRRGEARTIVTCRSVGPGVRHDLVNRDDLRGDRRCRAAGGRSAARDPRGRQFDDRDRRPPGTRGQHDPDHDPRRDAGGPPSRSGPPNRSGPPYRSGPPNRTGPRDRGAPPSASGRPPFQSGRPDRGGPPGSPPFRRPAYGQPTRSIPPGPSRPPSRPWPRPGFEPAPWPRPDAGLPAPDLLGPDEELVAGRRPVEEVFAAGRTAHRLLVVPQRRSALEQLVLHATRLRIPIVEVEGGSLTAIAGFDGHQGVALVVEPRRFATLGDILARAEERDEPPFVLVLDSLEDPQNVGTLLRTAEASGVHGVVFPTRRQAPLSPAAVKASAGATEHLLLCPVDDLAGTLADLHVRGLRDRRRRGGRSADRPPDRPPRTAGDRHRQRGPGTGSGHPTTVRPVHADPDARGDRLAQCGSRGLGPAVRGGRAARS